ncbi:MAG: hypothetical protein AAB834_07295, partial [Patescibacteria group bacterium]
TGFRGAEGGSRDHYPYVTRSLLQLYDEGTLTNVTDVLVEPDYGHIARITYYDGSHRITYGNDLGLNTGAAAELAKDRGHSKFLLRALGVECPDGDEFLLPWWAERIGPSQHARGNHFIKTTDMAHGYIEAHYGYPMYVKPVDGSKGADIFKVYDHGQLTDAFNTYNEKKVRVAMVEKPIDMPDYRIVTLDGELISAYRRIPLAVIGDGESTVRQLVDALQQRYFDEGRDTRLNAEDPRIAQYLSRQGLDLEHRPIAEQEIVLAAVSNLSAGGTSEDVTEIIAPRWIELAGYVANNFNLRLCGLDLGRESIINDSSPHSVIEVNAAPGLDHYALSGEAQKRVVHGLYTKVLNALPSTGR